MGRAAGGREEWSCVHYPREAAPVSRALVARQFRPRALPVLTPEKPESFAFCPPESQRRAHVEMAPRRLSEVAPHVPGDVATLVDRCLEKNPARRPRGCREVATALEMRAAPFVTADLIAGSSARQNEQTSGASAFDAFVNEPRAQDPGRVRRLFLMILAACFTVAMIGLTMAYFGPVVTPAWELRFDRLGFPELPRGLGFTIEAARSAIFLSLVFTVAYVRFRLPLERFFAPRLNTRRVWLARVVFTTAMLVFLAAEFGRQWFPEGSATDTVAWAKDRDIETTPAREVAPYRWYLGYSFVHYTCVFGSLLLLPILQFSLADLAYVRRAMSLFAAAQRAEPNGMEAVDRLYAMARVLRQLAARYVDTAGVLSIGVQYEYWIGRWTLSEDGYVIEVVGMLVTAGIMVLILGYIATQYSEAIEITASGGDGHLDHRLEQRLEQFRVGWFLRSAIFSRPSGIALSSLLFLAIVAGRRSLF